MGREHTGTSTSRLLGMGGMRGGIGTRKEFGIARRRRLEQRLPMRLALEDGEAVEVWLDPPHQEGVAIVQQMVTRNGRPDIGRRGIDVVDRLLRRDVFHNNLEGGEVGNQRFHDFLNELALPIEDVDGRSRHLGMDAQDHAHLGHGLEGRVRLFHVRDAELRVRRGSRRIILARLDVSGGVGLADFVGGGDVGEVECHEGFELIRTADAVGEGLEDVLPVGQGLFRVDDGRLEVGHGNRPAEALGGQPQHIRDLGPVAKVMMKVVGHGQSDLRPRRDAVRLKVGGGGRVTGCHQGGATVG
mmetsp:Transcript_6553/g.18281  ORF Transcript_6553/g.18281 Transcript_6553/m.18281 type:complete len:300 (+) Transcript_6553:314-1213(+)